MLYVLRFEIDFKALAFLNFWPTLSTGFDISVGFFFIFTAIIAVMGYWHQRADERRGNPPPR